MWMYLGVKCWNLHISLNLTAALLLSNFFLVFFIMIDVSFLLNIYLSYCTLPDDVS